MSSYGPPGGPYHPGQPRDPYGEPSDPWDGQDSPVTPGGPDYGYQPPASPDPGYGYDTPRHGEPTYHEPRYGNPAYQPPYGDPYQQPAVPWAPPPPTPRSSTGLIVTIAAVLGVLVLGGGASAFYLLNRGEPRDNPTTAATSAAPGQPAGAPSSAAAYSSPTPAPVSTAEARFATAGQCLLNDGTDQDPRMRIVACAPNTYEVLARFDGTIDYKDRCAKVRDYQFHYFFDSELDALDFVLCLKRR